MHTLLAMYWLKFAKVFVTIYYYLNQPLEPLESSRAAASDQM
jgi:hypothetical protein